MRKFRFGVTCNGTTELDTGWADFAREVEDLGYSSLHVADHFGNQLAPLPALTAAAMVTSRLELGGLVYCNDYKHPVVLAKEVATLDVLSGGRAQLGLGAGWLKPEYEQVGLSLDPAGVRIDRMVEALRLIRALFEEGPVSFAGEHYRTKDLHGFPKPLRRIPVLIGGGGKKMLSAAAREADIVGINLNLKKGEIDAELVSNTSARSTEEKVGWVREAAGERYSQLELNMMLWSARITDRRSEVLEELTSELGVSLAESAHVVVGSVDSVCERLLELRELYDISYFVVRGQHFREFAPVVERLL